MKSSSCTALYPIKSLSLLDLLLFLCPSFARLALIAAPNAGVRSLYGAMFNILGTCMMTVILVMPSASVILILLLACKAISFTVSNDILGLMNLRIQTVSLAACAGAIYRALVVNVDTVFCFLLISSEVAICEFDQAVLWWAPCRRPIWSLAVQKERVITEDRYKGTDGEYTWRKVIQTERDYTWNRGGYRQYRVTH